MTENMQPISLNPAADKKAEEEKSEARKEYEEGLEFLENKDLSQAANRIHNALLGFERDKDVNGIANATDKLGDICVKSEDYDKAMMHYDRCYEICQQEADNSSLFSLEKKKASLLADMGRYEEAITMHLYIIDEYQKMRNQEGAVDYLCKLSWVFKKKGDKTAAADCYRTAAGIHKNFGHPRHSETLMNRAQEIDNESR